MSIRSIFSVRHDPTSRFQRLFAHFHKLAGLKRTRLGLGRLDDHLLADIGLTRHEARTEASRPLWDAPLHWKTRKVDSYRGSDGPRCLK